MPVSFTNKIMRKRFLEAVANAAKLKKLFVLGVLWTPLWRRKSRTLKNGAEKRSQRQRQPGKIAEKVYFPSKGSKQYLSLNHVVSKGF